MKKIYVLLGAFGIMSMFILTTAYDGINPHGDSRESSGIDANTGSPGDIETCGECHGGAESVQNSWFTSDIPGTGYVAGYTYSVTLTAVGGGGGSDKGFSIVCENGAAADLGTFAESASDMGIGNGHVFHTSPRTSGTWTFDWTAPATGAGTATFYACVVSDGYSGALGTVVVAFDEGPVGIAEADAKGGFSVYPNPVIDELTVELAQVKGATVNVTIFSITGQLVFNEDVDVTGNNFKTTFDLTHLNAGTYFVKVNNGNNNHIQKVIVR